MTTMVWPRPDGLWSPTPVDGVDGCDMTDVPLDGWVEQFTRRDCWRLAIRLAALLDMQCWSVFDVHAVAGDGTWFVDVCGWHSGDTLLDYWGPSAEFPARWHADVPPLFVRSADELASWALGGEVLPEVVVDHVAGLVPRRLAGPERDGAAVTADGLVQAIVVGRDGSHDDTVTAAATAAVTAWWLLRATDPVWSVWLQTAFTKTVRHTNDRELTKIAAFCPLPPVSYELMDRRVRRCQVAGLDRPRSTAMPARAAGLVVSACPTLPMSTGKVAAQAAHALILHALSTDAHVVDGWAAAGFPFTFDAAGVWFDDAEGRVVAVRDAGFTEVAPGSTTVKAWLVS